LIAVVLQLSLVGVVVMSLARGVPAHANICRQLSAATATATITAATAAAADDSER
jgi:hypothetical protein